MYNIFKQRCEHYFVFIRILIFDGSHFMEGVGEGGGVSDGTMVFPHLSSIGNVSNNETHTCDNPNQQSVEYMFVLDFDLEEKERVGEHGGCKTGAVTK